MQLLINAIADKVASKLHLKTDVVSQIVNDASKAASMAALYSLKQTTDTLNSNLAVRGNITNHNVVSLQTRISTWVTNADMSLLPGDYLLIASIAMPRTQDFKDACTIKFFNYTSDSEVAGGRDTAAIGVGITAGASINAYVSLAGRSTICLQTYATQEFTISIANFQAIRLK